MSSGKYILMSLFLTALIGPVVSQFKSCSDNSVVTKVLCNGEPTNCILKRGASSDLTVVFKPKESSVNLTSVCHGIIAGIPAPFNDIDHKGCDGLNPGCPVEAGKTYTFTTKIPVKSIYPQLKLIVKWEEQDPTGTDIFCIMLPAQIQ